MKRVTERGMNQAFVVVALLLAAYGLVALPARDAWIPVALAACVVLTALISRVSSSRSR